MTEQKEFKMSYNPENVADRLILAEMLKQGFPTFQEGTILSGMSREVVLSFLLPSGRKIKVYTSIQRSSLGSSGRWEDLMAVGATTIRVMAVGKNGGEWIPLLPSQKQVARTGTMEEIVLHSKEAVKEVLEAIKPLGKCHCGAWNALSKKGKPYCSARCFVKAKFFSQRRRGGIAYHQEPQAQSRSEVEE
jgi:hypothetical protein